MKMRSQARKGLNIIGHLSFKRIIFSSIIISIFAIGYFPFCTLDMMKPDDDEWVSLNYYIEEYMDRMYLIKGRSFNATSHDGERFTVYLGWDDCVYIKKGEIKKKILVNKMLNTRWSNEIIDWECHTIIIQDKDTTFEGESFFDIKDSVILYIYKQPAGLPYGRQKYGFDVNIDNWKFKSGRDNYFDY